MQHVGVLANDADRVVQRLLGDRPDVLPADEHRAGTHVVDAAEQLRLIVVFLAPDGPTSAINSPASARNEMSLSTSAVGVASSRAMFSSDASDTSSAVG